MVNELGAAFGKFKFSINDKIVTYNRNLVIIDREYREKIKTKNNRQYTANEKYYLYKCLNCGNEDWILENSICEKQHCGCNVCCMPPKKIVSGINDITVTAPWMIKYFKNGMSEASKYSKYSKDKVEFVCPDCGKTYIKSINIVMANGGLSCICSDNISYPNKFMYALLNELHIDFLTEKSFSWSNNCRYDFFIPKFNIIIEMNGIQHYEQRFLKSDKSRTLEEEINNDKFKKAIAINNGIVNYFSIDCRKSVCEFIKKSILSSGLLEVLNVSDSDIDWCNCDRFATSNFAKTVCMYKKDNPLITLHEVADKFKISYNTVLKFIKTGNKFGWCNYKVNDDLYMLLSNNKIQRGQKPIYCESIDMYFRTSDVAAEYLSSENSVLHGRQIRKSISRNHKYFGYKFSFITQEQFNKEKLESPSKAVGDFFYI